MNECKNSNCKCTPNVPNMSFYFVMYEPVVAAASLTLAFEAVASAANISVSPGIKPSTSGG